MGTIPSNFNFPTKNQIPDHAIMDYYNKQVYLANSYVYTSIATAGGTSEANLYLLSNPVANGSGSKLLSLFCNIRRIAALTASHSVIMRFYINPTVLTSGTPVTPINQRTASGNSSAMVLSLGPSVSANGTLIDVVQAMNAQAAESDFMIILDPGQSMLITTTASNTSDSLAPVIGWYEL